MTLPTGTGTFLFTDIEGSTEHWEREREAMAALLVRHNVTLAGAIRAYSGLELNTVDSASVEANLQGTQIDDRAIATLGALFCRLDEGRTGNAPLLT
jgi:class 3 adenylate cyclase